MRSPFFLVLPAVTALGLSGCAIFEPLFESRYEANNGPPTVFVPATMVHQPVSAVAVTPAPAYQPPEQLRALPAASPTSLQQAQAGMPAIKEANNVARYRSIPAGFINAVQHFDYMEGALYEVYTAPGYVTAITLQPGEQLVTYAAGDTVRWVIGDVTSGTAAAQQTLVLVKPIRPDTRTNLVITTDRRVYLVEARSVKSDTYNAAIAWNYPHDEMAKYAEELQRSAELNANTISKRISIDELNFDYEISGDNPRWRPLRAFDDGAKTYIEFPPNLGTSEAPPLFVIGKSGAAQLVNYRVKGRYYEVDRLIEAAELRLGEDPQTIVRITAESRSRETAWWQRGSSDTASKQSFRTVANR